MSLISMIHMADYRNALHMHGYAMADFKLTEKVDPHVTNEFASSGMLVVTHTLTLMQKSYPVGFGSRWISDFEHDLARHAFHAT